MLQCSRVPGSIQVNIELGDGHVQTEVCEALQVLLERVRDLVECEMALEADGVDRHAVCDEGLHNAVERVGLGVDAFDAVVIYAIQTVRFICCIWSRGILLEFRLIIHRARVCQRLWHCLLSKLLRPNVILECLVRGAIRDHFIL